MRRNTILLLLTLLLSACASAPMATSPANLDQSAIETAAVVPTLETAAPAAPNASPTSLPTHTASIAASATHTPAPTVRLTSTATSEPSPTATVETRTLPDGAVMIYVPPGDFTMGSPAGAGSDEEFPMHTVTLDGFWINRTEVTNAQYRLFVDASAHPAPTTCDWGETAYEDAAKADHPVVCVSWEDAQAYCQWIGGRLPTEAEWEKAARGTDARTYPWGHGFDGSRLNYCDASCTLEHKDASTDDGYAQTAPVGSFPSGASPYAVLDMAGNVWEWVADWYNFFYYGKSPQLNPLGPNMGEERVLRGGAWNGSDSNARSAFRAWLEPEKKDIGIGFRCVMP